MESTQVTPSQSARLPYEPPKATFIALKQDERLFTSFNPIVPPNCEFPPIVPPNCDLG